ncbi:DUF4476 domain-containing protein [Archangium lansingense]|uniref:DUF4476 domain-containing protein n=1 Tax=Archangium lansingense TaxID=2995310 RepID=A0ABT4AKJ2_9BACT|nr:DUF4476 domain-containing protein [Archangium lansinium]MCY1082208.1 DUF4476 domain-containing protein [Archangium lansinium]
MRAVLIAVATLLAAPALAQNNKQEPPTAKADFRPPPGPGPGAPLPNTQATPVVVDRDTLMRQLAVINDRLAQAASKAKKDKQLLKLIDDARADLKEVGRQVTNAPPTRLEPQRPPPLPTVQPITEAMLRSLVAAIRNEPFSDDQLAVLEEAVSTQYFLVAQTQDILRNFRFSQDRLKAMRMLRPRLLDLENGFKLYESFDYSNDKDELKRILAAPTP